MRIKNQVIDGCSSLQLHKDTTSLIRSRLEVFNEVLHIIPAVNEKDEVHCSQFSKLT